MALADRECARRLQKNLEAEEDCYEFVGYCSDRRNDDGLTLGALEDISELVEKHNVDVLVVARKYQNHPQALEQCFRVAAGNTQVQDESSFWEDFLEQVQIDSVDKGAFYNLRLGKRTRTSLALKRAIDILCGLIGLVVSLPIMAVVALAIRLTSGAPVLFRQDRCGQYGNVFQIYKFRTMISTAESNGAQWAATDDPRVTKLGAFLRKTRLDELPQFWNVLHGEMSMVGPRPERPELVDQIERSVPYFSLRHWARPGLTGLAQIRFRYAASMEDAREKLRYDLYYIKNWSLFLDLKILLRTVSMMMKGAR
jgi:exopolysaccharide biosynthesis polyprenyl glycosylphosphotransferase